MTTLIFVALGQGTQASGYSARVPDLPSVSVTAATMAELLAQARESVLQALGEMADEGAEWPTPTPLETVSAGAGDIAFLVDVTVEDAPLRVNISIGERLLKRIDQTAEGRGMSRSGFIAAACRAALGERQAKTGAAELDAVARRLQEEWTVLGRKLTESLGPDSVFHRNLAEVDNRLTETIRKTADGISAAMARRQEAEARASQPEAPPSEGSSETFGHA